MISKYIERRLKELQLGQTQKEDYLAELVSIRSKYTVQRSNSFMLKKICFRFLKVCEAQMRRRGTGCGKDGLTIINLIKEITLEIYEEQSFETFLIKIQAYLLSLRCYELQGEESARTSYLKRIKLFLREVQSSVFNEAISSDYYSNIELLYLEVISDDLAQLDYSQCEIYVLKCFDMLRTQIMSLNELISFEEDKVYSNLKVKNALFSRLYTLECGLKMLSAMDNLELIPAQIYEKYQRVTETIPILVEKGREIARCLAFIPTFPSASKIKKKNKVISALKLKISPQKPLLPFLLEEKQISVNLIGEVKESQSKKCTLSCFGEIFDGSKPEKIEKVRNPLKRPEAVLSMNGGNTRMSQAILAARLEELRRTNPMRQARQKSKSCMIGRRKELVQNGIYVNMCYALV